MEKIEWQLKSEHKKLVDISVLPCGTYNALSVYSGAAGRIKGVEALFVWMQSIPHFSLLQRLSSSNAWI